MLAPYRTSGYNWIKGWMKRVTRGSTFFWVGASDWKTIFPFGKKGGCRLGPRNGDVELRYSRCAAYAGRRQVAENPHVEYGQAGSAHSLSDTRDGGTAVPARQRRIGGYRSG